MSCITYGNVSPPFLPLTVLKALLLLPDDVTFKHCGLQNCEQWLHTAIRETAERLGMSCSCRITRFPVSGRELKRADKAECPKHRSRSSAPMCLPRLHARTTREERKE
jgi:hypothetical protein